MIQDHPSSTGYILDKTKAPFEAFNFNRLDFKAGRTGTIPIVCRAQMGNFLRRPV